MVEGRHPPPTAVTVMETTRPKLTRGSVVLADTYTHKSSPRIVVVTRITHSEHFAGGIIEVALVHPYPELATDFDLVVPKGEVTPYPLVIQSDLRGIIARHQVVRGVSWVDLDVDWPTGTPLHGQHDQRWEFKASEGADLDALTDLRTSEVLAAHR